MPIPIPSNPLPGSVPSYTPPQQQQNYGRAPGEYGAPGPGGWTWGQGAEQQFLSENSFDPTTGAPIGPGGIPPAGIALQQQGMHDRLVWQYRQNLMRSALNYARGAGGLLQSFRPGGSAAIEAGTYNNLANIQLSRASMTQPLDLLGDYRRHEMAANRQSANRQRERALAVQGAVALASLVAGNYGGALSGLAGLLGGAMGNQGPQPMMAPGGPTGTGAIYGGESVGPSGQPIGAPSAFDSGIGQPAPKSPGPGAPTGMATLGEEPQGGQQPKQIQPGGMPGQQPGGVGQQGGGGGEDQPGGAMGGMGGPVGADGNFSPTAYASRSAGMAGQDPIQQIALMRSLANTLDQDPVWDELTVAIDARMRERFAA